MAGVGAWATLAALASAWVTSHWLGTTLYTPYFVVASISIVLSAGCAAGLSVHPDRPQRARLILRPEYGLFYLLTFLEGCRRQIFSIFASFALILVNAVLIGISSPAIGKVIDRKGERSPLMLYSVGLIVVFLGYATIRNVYALYSLFLIDNILFSFGVGFTTYLHRIVREGEMTPCLAMGTTMNHIAAVVVPIGGAYLWQRYHNYNLPFWVGVSIAVVALIANQWLPSGPAPANVGEHDILAAETPSEERTAHVSVP
jgi:MFS family permease